MFQLNEPLNFWITYRFRIEYFIFSNLNAYSSLSTTNSPDAQTITRVAEEKIRVKTIALGLRVTEFFHDFDRLRSGYVTASQFKRYIIKIIFSLS